MMTPETDQEEKRIMNKIFLKIFCPNCGMKRAVSLDISHFCGDQGMVLTKYKCQVNVCWTEFYIEE